MEETIQLLLGGMMIAWVLGGIGTLLARKHLTLANNIAYVGALVGSLFGAASAIMIFISNETLHFPLWSIVPTIQFSFSVDALSAFFLLVISVIAFIVSIYAPSYTSKYYGLKNVSLLGVGFNLFLLSMVGVVLANNGFTFLVMWETMSIISFLLVIYEHEKEEVRRSGLLYVIMTHLGTGFIIVSFLLLFLHTGTLDFGQLSLVGKQLSTNTKHVVFLLALIGFGTKAGIVPIHVWLPRAHPVAPTHVSALMSAVMIKTALYGLIRVVYQFIGIEAVWWGVTVVIVGIITATYGIMYGVVQQDMKRFLAYSSVENMGLIFIGLGVSFIFTALDQSVLASFALLATLYHTINHALFKGLLFMGVGAVYRATGTRRIDQLGGLIRAMPQTAILFLFGTLAVASLPPLNGFVSKWFTFQALLQLPFQSAGNGWLSLLGLVGVVALLFVGALVALGFVKLFGVIFLAQPRSEQARKAKEVPLLMRLSMWIPVLGIIGLGLFPGLMTTQLQRVTTAIFPHTTIQLGDLFQLHSVAETASAIEPLQLLIALVIVGLFTFVFLIASFGKSVHQDGEPWACGVTLQPDMAYSGMSLSHPLLFIFKPLYGKGFVSRVEGRQITFSLQLRQAFTRLLYEPLIRIVMFISRQIRKIQDGSIHTYLAYIFVTLLIMLVIVTRN